MPKIISHKYNFVYKTTNNINGDYYYGVHSTNNLDDGYMGSGLRITRAIKYYGKENFTREIVQYFSNVKNAYILEAAIVTPELVKDPHCYNIAEGGHGGYVIAGFTDEQRNDHYKKIGKSLTGRPAWNKGLSKDTDQRVTNYANSLSGHNLSQEARNKISKKAKQRYSDPTKNPMYGKTHTEEARKKMREKKIGYTPWNKGKKYSKERCEAISKQNIGKFKDRKWINNGKESKFIKNEEIYQYLSNGWKLGRNVTRSQYVWINNSKQNKMITQTELSIYLNNGWELGMLKKK